VLPVGEAGGTTTSRKRYTVNVAPSTAVSAPQIAVPQSVNPAAIDLTGTTSVFVAWS
jgi:hypothetical protein